ncbi:HEAT repeat domain-containing protein [Bradyrhizobium sp. F1.13.3]|uniref:HEAT repeat domain-containing protein n=1 Tax=Bradyrhizobium sp. F1.13.3 TaxID=3156351 RepID=UPI003393AB8F
MKSDAILERMRVPSHEKLFVLGCFERPATLYMQQVRALNLIYSLNQRKGETEPTLAVIGAGGAGVTAAGAAAICGWTVSIFDKIDGDILSFAGADTTKRWLHPHIYEWPALGKEIPDAHLCILNWSSAPANRVIHTLRQQWYLLRDKHGIEEHLGAQEIAVERLNEQYLVKWNGAPPKSPRQTWRERSRRMNVELFDIVIIAVGFGKEEPNENFPIVKSYWEADNIDAYRQTGMTAPTVLVSGTGDGGIIDVLRFSFREFRHDRVLEQLENEWLGRPEFNRVRQELAVAEAQAIELRKQGRSYAPQLNLDFRRIADSIQPKRQIPLRKDVVPILTGTNTLPLSLEAAPLNRFLFCLTDAQYIQGPLQKAEKLSKETIDVHFASGLKASFQDVVIRHGPTSAIRTSFKEIYAQCANLEKESRTTPDPSREPIFDRAFSDFLRSESGAADAAASPSVSPEHLQSAVTAARFDQDADVSYHLYQQTLHAALAAAVPAELTALLPTRVVVPLSGLTKDQPPRTAGPETVRLEWLRSREPATLIVAEAGAGKTTLLKWLAVEAATEGRLFPLYVPLFGTAEFDENSLFASMFAQAAGLGELSEPQIASLKRLFTRRLFQGRVLLLLDGFDALVPSLQDRFARALQRHLVSADRNKILVSSRPTTSTLPSYRLLPFALPDILDVLKSATVDDPSGVPIIPTELLIRFPALFSAAIEGRSFRGAPPGVGKIALLHRAIVKLLGPSPERGPMLLALASLALQRRTEVSFSRSDLETALDDQLETKPDDFDQLVSSTLSSRLVMQASEEDRFAFVHRSIQEYLAAVAIAHEPEPLIAIASIAFSDDANFEIAAMAIIELGNIEATLDTIKAAPDSFDLVLLQLRSRVAALAADISLSYCERLSTEIAILVASPWTAAEEPLLQVASSLRGSGQALTTALTNRLAKLAASDDWEIASRALRFVAASGLPGSATIVYPALSSAEKYVRQIAAETLGSLGDPSAIPVLLQSYLDPSHDLVFAPAVDAIATIGGEAAERTLTGVLSDKTQYRNIRWPVVHSLAVIGSSNARLAIEAAARDDEEIVRSNALTALGQFRDHASLPIMLDALSDTSDDIRSSAAEALIEIPDAQAVDKLQLAAVDRNPRVRENACRALAHLDQAKLVDILRSCLVDPYCGWRGQAARLLAEFLGSDAFETVSLLSSEQDETVREGAAEALKIIPSEASAELLLRLTDDDSEQVRSSAVLGLQQHRCLRAIPRLSELAERDSSNFVRLVAIRAIGELGDRAGLSVLVRLLETEDTGLFDYVALSLGDIGDDAAIPALISANRRSTRTDAERYFAVALARIGGRTAASALATMMNSNQESALSVTVAIRQMKDEFAVPLLLKARNLASPISARALEVLASMPRRVIRTGLMLALADDDAETRSSAAQSAAFYADGELSMELQYLAAAPLPQVAEAARQALGLIESKSFKTLPNAGP